MAELGSGAGYCYCVVDSVDLAAVVYWQVIIMLVVIELFID